MTSRTLTPPAVLQPAAPALAMRHRALRARMAAALGAASAAGRDAAPVVALLAVLRTGAQWEAGQLHPWLEASCPGSSLPLADALVELEHLAQSIELELLDDGQASAAEQRAAWQRVSRRVARLVGRQLLHLDALEQLDLDALAQHLEGGRPRAAAESDPPTPNSETDR